MVFVTESGLYRLVIRSKKEEAIKFQNWICEDVLPCIRKYGTYPKPEIEQITLNNSFYITTESSLPYKVVNYIRKYYPNTLMTAPMGELQDTKEKRLDAYNKAYIGGMPDLIIFDRSNQYNGFCIEFKTPKGNGILSIRQKQTKIKNRNIDFWIRAKVLYN